MSEPTPSQADFSGYPRPILTLLDQARAAADPIARFVLLGNLSEVLLRYTSSLTLASFFGDGPRTGSVSRLLATLQRPSLGHWCQILRELTRSLSEAEALGEIHRSQSGPSELKEHYRSLQYFLGKKRVAAPRKLNLAGFFDLLVAFRNKTRGHGAVQAELAARLNPHLEAGLCEAMRLMDYLTALRLELVAGGTVHSLMGRPFAGEALPAEGQLRVCGPDAEATALPPLLVWHEGRTWFLNGFTPGKTAAYICYETGDHREVEPGMEGPLSQLEPNPGAPGFEDVTLDVSSDVPIWQCEADLAVIFQDVNRVVGPQPAIDLATDSEAELKQLIAQLELTFEPDRQGDLIVGSRRWCAARWLCEAVIYDVEQDPITTRDVVGYAIGGVLQQAAALGVRSLAMSPLGTEYGVVSADEFAGMLRQAYDRLRPDLGALERITLVPRTAEQTPGLRAALAGGAL